jgi:Flp pilus assembly protein TadD
MDKTTGEEKELGKYYLKYLAKNTGNDGKKIEALGEKGGTLAKVLALKVLLDRDAPASEIRSAVAKLPERLNDFGAYAYVLRGDARTRLALFNEAQNDFHQALQIEPRSAVAHWAYAIFLKKTQRGEDADIEIRNLLSYHPDYIPAVVSTHQF